VLLASAAALGATSTSADRVKDNLYGVKFVDDMQGWAVGDFGSISHTRDGGKTWHLENSHTTEMLFDVDFVDAQHGWISGRSGLILHTDDGGETWVQQKSPTDKHLFAIDFVDSQFGCIAGDWGAVLVTRDGGQTWEDRTLTHDVILNDIAMIDRKRGFIVGEAGTVLATEDGCNTWTKRDSGVSKSLFGVDFVNAQHGWAVGIDALILETQDAGLTWQVRNGSTEVRALEQVGFAQAYDNPSLYGIAVVGQKGYAAGEIGAVFLSNDGGHTWTRAPSGDATESTWFRALSVVPGPNGVLVGAKGMRRMIKNGELQSIGEDTRAAEAVH
jgi:photosystem II stability/assembly factor-like uncharacterized protein